MKLDKKSATLMGALAALVSGEASAHLTYTGRDFGIFTGSGSFTIPTISVANISSDFGWAASTDANYGDSHRLRAFRFNLASAGIVTLAVQSNTVGFLPGFSIYSGLSHLTPEAAAHDGSELSLFIRGETIGPTKVGSLFGLDDWEIGNSDIYNTPGDPLSGVLVPASRRAFDYMGNAADGTSANYGLAAGINGDGTADGFVTGTFNLAAGDYSIFVGGANFSSEGPAPYTSYASTLTLTAIPEPSSSLLLGLAGLGLMLRRQR